VTHSSFSILFPSNLSTLVHVDPTSTIILFIFPILFIFYNSIYQAENTEINSKINKLINTFLPLIRAVKLDKKTNTLICYTNLTLFI